MKLTDRILEISSILEDDFENLYSINKEILSIEVVGLPNTDEVIIGVVVTHDFRGCIPDSFKVYLPFRGDIVIPTRVQKK